MTKLAVTKREEKKPAALRREGFVPAVVYGKKEPSTPISVPLRDFEKAYASAGETSVVELSGLGESKDAMIHEVVYDPLTGKPVHVDFYAFEKGQKVTVPIPFEFVNEAPGVAEKGGVLIKVMHELEVTGEPKNLPHELTVDLLALKELHDKVTVGDLSLPAGVTTEMTPEDVVVMVDEVKEEPVEETPMDISEIETSVERGKKEEESAEGEAAAPEAKSEKKDEKKI